MLVIGDSSFPGQVSLGILCRFPSALLSWALLFVSFSLFLSFLPKTTKRYWQRLLLAPLCSSPHPICSLPEFPFKSTQPYKERTQWKCPKLLDTKNVFKKNPLKNNFKPKHYIFIRETSEDTDRYKQICKE